MSPIDAILMAIPLLTYIGFMLSVKFGKVSNIVLFAVITLATIILGVISISVIQPVDTGDSGMRGLLTNAIVTIYIASMIYGGYFGAAKGNYERVIVGGIFILLITLTSAAM